MTVITFKLNVVYVLMLISKSISYSHYSKTLNTFVNFNLIQTIIVKLYIFTLLYMHVIV